MKEKRYKGSKELITEMKELRKSIADDKVAAAQLMDKLNKLDSEILRKEDRAQSAENAIENALVKEGMSKDRATAVARGYHHDLPDEYMDILMSDELAANRTINAENLFKKNCINEENGRAHLSFEEMCRFIYTGFKLRDMDSIYHEVSSIPDASRKELLPVVLKPEYSGWRIMRIVSLFVNDGYSAEILDRCFSMPLKSEQIVSVFGFPYDFVYQYRGEKRMLCELPLFRKQLSSRPLTDEELEFLCNDKLPAKLISLLKLALLSGLTVKEISGYADPNISIEETLNDLTKMVTDKRKAKTA